MGPLSDNRAEVIPPECQFYKSETGCKAGDKCQFPHYKVDEQPKTKPRKRASSHKRRENDDKNVVAIVKSVSQLGCVPQDSDALASQGTRVSGKPDAESLGTNSKGTVH